MMSKKLITLLAVLFLSIGTALAKDFRTVVFKVEQMMCQNCEKKVKDNIKFEKGMKKFTTDLKAKTVTITYDAEKTNIEQLKAGFKKFKYEAVVVEDKKEE
ncbi:heavy-metal-associated domain-containing protein [Bacteroides sp. 51]|uniref:heavy-metal-associated domain-containing protein n=1 Tax=Bacteroides sp. 51 TaxID=2302938 RepID=UPI0013D17730|nr:heavy-metal-associated domain-containing protein [Bacteroides sp. 51]NDV82625.1 cation transporter [Bacteroides sp. 51]